MMACVGQPISWLRLERYAMSGGDAAIRDHVAACAVCRQCLDEIERDVVALPLLAFEPRRRWWKLALPIAGALAAAALALFLLRPREPREAGIARIKGFGVVEVDVVRERGGETRDDVRSFAPGDRWKVIVTCPLDRPVWLDVAVVEAGASRADYPLAATRIVCGNRVVVPGAFTVTGNKPHRVCVRIVTDELAPARSLPTADDACLTVRPDPEDLRRIQ